MDAPQRLHDQLLGIRILLRSGDQLTLVNFAASRGIVHVTGVLINAQISVLCVFFEVALRFSKKMLCQND